MVTNPCAAKHEAVDFWIHVSQLKKALNSDRWCTQSLPLVPVWMRPICIIYCERAVQIVFRFSSKRVILYVALSLVCTWEKVKSGLSNRLSWTTCVSFTLVLYYFLWKDNHHLYHCFLCVLLWFSLTACKVIYYFAFQVFHYEVLGAFRLLFDVPYLGFIKPT